MQTLRFFAAGLAFLAALVLSAPILALALPLWGVAALTKLVGSGLRALQPPEVSWEELIEFEPEIGWKNRGGVDTHVRGEQTFRVRTDPEGWRGRGTIEDADVVAFGDSFAFGHGVDDRHHFANRASSIRVKSVGTNAYNMVHTLLWMERMRERLSGKLVVWFAFYGNDLADNLCPSFGRYRTPFVRSVGDGTEEWEIVTDHVSPEPWPFESGWYARASDVCVEGFRADRIYGACGFLIDRARRICASVGARLVVVGVPEVKLLDPAERNRLKARSGDRDRFDPGLPDRRLQGICEEQGLRFVPLSRRLVVADHLPDDCHWTPVGHRKVARLLEELHQEAPAPGREGGPARRRAGWTPPVETTGKR